MFCDEVLDWFTIQSLNSPINITSPVKTRPEYVDTARNAMKTAEHIVLEDSALRAIDELANPRLVENQRDLLVLPARCTWLEWRGKSNGLGHGIKKHGMLFHQTTEAGEALPEEEGTELVRTATALYFSEVMFEARPCIQVMSMAFDTRTNGYGILRRQGVAQRRFLMGEPDPHASVWSTVTLDTASAWLGATLAVLATPRVYTSVSDDRAKLNKNRRKQGKPEFVPYRKVFVDIGKEYERKPYTAGAAYEGGSIQGKRARHQVRPFLRLKQGKVEIVRPHWRGDAALGTVRHNYVVR